MCKRYFISYASWNEDGTLGFGRTQVTINSDMHAIETIATIEGELKRQYPDLVIVVVLFWRLFEELDMKGSSDEPS